MGVRQSLAIFLTSLALAPARAEFFPRLESVEPRPSVGGAPGSWSLGLAVDALWPLGAAFNSATLGSNGSSEFRFQTPLSFGFEVAHVFAPNLEWGVGLSYARLESRFQKSGSPLPEVQSLSWNTLPLLRALGRYRIPLKNGVAAEFEASLGAGYAHTRVVSTDLSAATIENSRTAFSAHAAAGLGFAWAEDYTAHFALGFGSLLLGSDRYQSGGALDVRQASALSGFFFKSQARYQF